MTLPKITKKQQEILRLIPRFRYLHRIHIQQLLNHKDKRRINSWLKVLTELNFIEKVDHKKEDLGDTFIEHNKPAVCRLGVNGIRWLKKYGDEGRVDENGEDYFDTRLIHNLYRQKDRSDEFEILCLLLADIYVDLLKQAREDPSIRLRFYTKTDYSSPSSPFSFLLDIGETGKSYLTVSPDAIMSKQIGKGKKNNYLLHLIPETMLRFRAHKLRRTVQEYLSFYQRAEWKSHTKTSFPTLLFILPDMQALIWLQRYIQTTFNKNDNPPIHFWLTTKRQIEKQRITNVDWEEVN